MIKSFDMSSISHPFGRSGYWQAVQRNNEIEEVEPMVHILRDIDIELWIKVKAKVTSERKTMCEIIFESIEKSMPVPLKEEEEKDELTERENGHLGKNLIFSPQDTGTGLKPRPCMAH